MDNMGEYDANDISGVDKELEEDFYFFKEKNGRWRLSIYKPLRWGIAGTAQIAEDVVEAMQLVPGVSVVAVAAGSSQEKAQGFADEHGVDRAYGSYEDLANDSDVDLVYISNLHTQHKDTVLTMVAAGKDILCEKPLSVNYKLTKLMIDAAREKKVFFMAGLWSRFFPAQKKYPEKGLASISYSMALNAPIEATIYGTRGTVKVHDRAHNPTKLTFTPADGPEVLFEFPQPPKPDSVSHGDAEGGWNFGGSMGTIFLATGDLCVGVVRG